jgi:hypothetical protein
MISKPGEIARSSAEIEEQQQDASSSFSAAAESEKLAGKLEPKGVNSLDGKLERTDMPESQEIEEVMKKSDKKREVLKKRPSENQNELQKIAEDQAKKD